MLETFILPSLITQLFDFDEARLSVLGLCSGLGSGFCSGFSCEFDCFEAYFALDFVYFALILKEQFFLLQSIQAHVAT